MNGYRFPDGLPLLFFDIFERADSHADGFERVVEVCEFGGRVFGAFDVPFEVADCLEGFGCGGEDEGGV